MRGVLLALFTFVACVRLPSAENAELSAAISAALEQIDPRGEMKLVASKDLSVAARAAAALTRTLLAHEEAPADLPWPYLRLDRAEIDGDKATVMFWKGPIPQPRPGEILLACGTGHMFQLKKDANGKWVVDSVGVQMC